MGLWAVGFTGLVAEFAVHRHFGPGVLESIYVKCLEQALKVAGHTVEREKSVTVSYMGTTFDEKLRCDLLVDDCLVIEAKSVEPCDLQRFRMFATPRTIPIVARATERE